MLLGKFVANREAKAISQLLNSAPNENFARTSGTPIYQGILCFAATYNSRHNEWYGSYVQGSSSQLVQAYYYEQFQFPGIHGAFAGVWGFCLFDCAPGGDLVAMETYEPSFFDCDGENIKSRANVTWNPYKRVGRILTGGFGVAYANVKCDD